MKKWLKWIGIFIGILAGVSFLGAVGLVLFFWSSMKPDHDEEKKVTNQATVYLKKHMNHAYEIYDVLYDNMGNFNEFEYAAKVRDKQTKTDFLVYFDEDSKRMKDTYVADHWQEEMEKTISPFLRQQYGKNHELMIFLDESVGYTFKRTLNNPGSYRDYDVRPTIILTLHRKKQSGDEKLFAKTIAFLQEKGGIPHADFSVNYIAENGVILDEKEWNKAF